MSSSPIISPSGYWRGATAHLHHKCSASVAAWIAEFLRGREELAIYDFGCGTGQYLRALEQRGFRMLEGFEGEIPDVREHERISQQDLTVPFDVRWPGDVICLEVGEHIPARFEDVFLENLTRACRGKLILSWAVRGQGGEGHVNCLDNREVIERLEARGFVYLQAATQAARLAASDDLPWFKWSLLVFERTS